MNRPAFIKPLLIVVVLAILGVGTYVGMNNNNDKTDLPGQSQMEENLAAIETLLQEGSNGNTTAHCRMLNESVCW